MRIKLLREWAGFLPGKVVTVSEVRGAYLVRLGLGENLDAPAEVPAIDPVDVPVEPTPEVPADVVSPVETSVTVTPPPSDSPAVVL